MGGSSYNVGVGRASRGKTYSDDADTKYSSKRKADDSVLVGGERRISTDAKNPIVIALDVTGSMGSSTKIMFDKMPMFWGQIEQKGYLPDPAVSFCAVGDIYTDQAPLQVTDFERARAIHPWLEKIWLEGGGGGQTMESYDLAALFYLTRVDAPNIEKGFFFFIGDEGFYPEMDGKPTVLIFKKLTEVYETFFIHWPYHDNSIADERIVKQWKEVMEERLLILQDPKAIVDVMLGLIAMLMGIHDLASYEEDLRSRGQNAKRVNTVSDVIKDFCPNQSIIKADTKIQKRQKGTFPNRDPFRKRQ